MFAKHDDFFAQAKKPDHFDERKTQIETFVLKHKDLGNRVVLVSSGGTTVPLESRTVRFIDNFSIGTRGSSSAEYFLKKDYAVIFLHRLRSLEPYKRHINHHIIDNLEIKNGSISVKDEPASHLKAILLEYQRVKERGMLLQIDFTALGDYLHLLHACAHSLRCLGNRAVLYLAAAVSDFYIPSKEMPEHKIQSSTNKPLQLSLQLVPKMLQPLVHDWAPNAFVVSFKLETDQSILIKKARSALDLYQHQIVIANVLDTRKVEIVIVSKDMEKHLKLTNHDQDARVEIEEKIVLELIELHREFIQK